MRTGNKDNNLAPNRIRSGRAMVVGLGLDDAEGHFRYTRGDAYELYGGSEDAHREMLRRMRRIQAEIAEMGITLDAVTYEQYEKIKDIVARVNAE